ncbi:Gfo/Idh/MocA family protein [Cohnella sp. JJ-181]|uniref:Gfo/Idh/MocA family protein n=1 Tax=Cohnella rhizoplanae TaxID=2974897 RepID=UPI0022FF5F46|nr:Gfo/Idh/MocA family oxidoreductase [Cohnella sp. JJ-181]CAI6086386.1 scyllo-inositol 2-dehydrogenase (NAD(+)) [Cohnella sp. JJ-181]
MSRIRVAVIGAGSISDFHLQSYQHNKRAELYAVCDMNGERAKQKADRFGAVRTYTDYRELLADPNLDAVSVCTWNNTHADISIAALRAGKHVLVEKPLCRTVEEALRVQAAVRETGKTFQIGYVRRYDDNAQLVREFVDRGEFGQIYYAKASYLRRFGNPGGWFADKDKSGGGPLIDLGVHVIDLMWYLMGRPKAENIKGHTYRRLGDRMNLKQHLSLYQAADAGSGPNNVEDMANAVIRFDNGASLMVDVSFSLHAAKDENIVKAYGDKGGFELDPVLSMTKELHDTILNITPQTDTPGLDVPRAFQNEIDHFVDCCLTGKRPISPVEDGVEMMKILCGIYESAESGREVTF